jgi:metal-dependent amidase/aminoacylase/carboxypeptidase family protein
MGAHIEIDDFPGYAPLINDDGMIEVYRDAAEIAVPNEKVGVSYRYTTGSTDMGELCRLMPVVHPYAGGVTGKGHGDDYKIADPYKACVSNAKMQLCMLLLLLGNGGERAKKIKSDFKPAFASKEEYFAYIDKLNSSGERITYHEDGATVKA